MKCKNCDALKTITNKDGELLCYKCYGVCEPFIINDINTDCNQYNMDYWDKKDTTNEKIRNSITFLKNWIKTDLNELDGDTVSDYAQFILSGHKHINIAINELERIINPMESCEK